MVNAVEFVKVFKVVKVVKVAKVVKAIANVGTKTATKTLTVQQALVKYQVVRSKISVVHGIRVMFAQDLAALFRVEAKVMMQAVQPNSDRFPSDFMFQLSNQSGRGGIRKLPYAFSEQRRSHAFKCAPQPSRRASEY